MALPLTQTELAEGLFAGRVWRPDAGGPSLVVLRNGVLRDITSVDTPTMSALLERGDAAEYARSAEGDTIGDVADAAANSLPGRRDPALPHLLAPCDLQAVKACGVTFAQSMIERVIEERAAGDAARAEAIRGRVGALIGDNLRGLKAGSEQAAQVKAALIEEGVWSQYLEVGIGPDAEVFTKAPVLASVGWGADVGLHPVSTWNNPEPEIVLAVNSRGEVKGATLGNDVNLRDVEGRSALLLGKAKDNNASSAIGPFIRLLDDGFTIDHVRNAELTLMVEGTDGFKLVGQSSMNRISRDPLDLVAQAAGRHHQYPDGFMLYLGTLFAPTQDRDAPGKGFTHHLGDTVTIRADGLGNLVNTVGLSTEIAPWTFGISALIKNLAARGLL